ncbi:flagellar assembly protein FliH [Firmicutes bacterium CAG:95]|nr:flagellar assembly protein FliH [Firmicutes bacterium CAG:95]
MTRSLFSNLYKVGFVHLGEDARVIDMNAILEKRLKEEAERRSRQPEHELVAAQDGFTEGLNAEKVDVLLEPDAEAASQQNASIQEQEQLKQEIEEARNELAGLQAQIEQEKEQAQLEIDQMKAKAFEEANEQGYQEGYRKGLDSVQELQKQCEDERLQQEQEYQKKLEEMEPLMVDTLCDVYSHIFKVEAKEHKELVLKLLQDTLLKVDGTGSIIVHVAKEDYAYVQEQKGALLEEAGMQSGSVEIVSDAALARAQCMIETEGGVYDCSLDTELAELKRRLMLLAYQKS